MALLSSGYWAINYWPSNYWEDNYWLETGQKEYINMVDFTGRSTHWVGNMFPLTFPIHLTAAIRIMSTVTTREEVDFTGRDLGDFAGRHIK